MYAKFIDKHTIEPLGKPCVTFNGVVYTNPCVELMRAAGYRLVKDVADKPSYDPEKQYLIPVYCEKGRGIIEQSYEVREIEVAE